MSLLLVLSLCTFLSTELIAEITNGKEKTFTENEILKTKEEDRKLLESANLNETFSEQKPDNENAEQWNFRTSSSNKQPKHEMNVTITDSNGTLLNTVTVDIPEVSSGNVLQQSTFSVNANSSKETKNSTINETASANTTTLKNNVNESVSENLIPQTITSINKTPNEDIQKPSMNETQNNVNATILDKKPNEVSGSATSGNSVPQTTTLDKKPVEGAQNISINETSNTTNANVLETKLNKITETGDKNVTEVASTNVIPSVNKDSMDTSSEEENKISLDNKTPKARLNGRYMGSTGSPFINFTSSGNENEDISHDETSVPSNQLTNKMLFNEYSTKQKSSMLHLKSSKSRTLGCTWISYLINTDCRNTWKALPYPQGTPYFNIFYNLIDDKRGKPDVSYEKELECPEAVCRLPSSYDSRKHYPMCSSLQQPLDQGCHCRGSWAVTAASAMSDRFCISTGGALDLQLSGQQVLSCCEYCGSASGCQGGQALYAWLYFHDRGVVSGSQYGHWKGCQPYLIRPCLSQYNPYIPISTPRCSDKCQPYFYYNYRRPFLYKAARVYTLNNPTINAIKKEIYFRGPVTAEFKIYEDFQCYKSGIYNHVAGDYLGFTAIKLIGWGEENGVPYWIAANAWGPNWGENGFFKVRMDSDGYNIATSVSAGIPLLDDTMAMR